MQHKAGRELDALVAEKVMGGLVSNPDELSQVDETWYWVHPKSGVLVGESYLLNEKKGLYDHQWQSFKPSTDIADAWQVVEAMQSKGWVVRVCQYQLNPLLWNCRFVPVNTAAYEFAVAENAPLAICLAALEVLNNG